MKEIKEAFESYKTHNVLLYFDNIDEYEDLEELLYSINPLTLDKYCQIDGTTTPCSICYKDGELILTITGRYPVYDYVTLEKPTWSLSVEELYNRNYITRDEVEEEKARRELVKSVGKPSMVVEPALGFNKSERYFARRTDLILSRDYKDKVEYDIKHDDNLSITPFDSSVVQIIKEVPKEPDKKDIVKAIMNLEPAELEMLDQSVRELIAVKSHKRVLRYPDNRKVA